MTWQVTLIAFLYQYGLVASQLISKWPNERNGSALTKGDSYLIDNVDIWSYSLTIAKRRSYTQ